MSYVPPRRAEESRRVIQILEPSVVYATSVDGASHELGGAEES